MDERFDPLTDHAIKSFCVDATIARFRRSDRAIVRADDQRSLRSPTSIQTSMSRSRQFRSRKTALR
jgi:hypothetical protein